jgi:probable phosphoglycerate mutase
METALPIVENLGCPLSVQEGLAEYDALEGQYIPAEELRASRDPRWLDIVSGAAISDPEIFQTRVVDTIEALIADHPGQRVLVACHGGVIGAYLGHVLGIQQLLFFEAGYTSISRVLAASTGERTVASMNELAHLRVARVPLYVDGD